MTEVIVFPDVEDMLVAHLGAELSTRGDIATVHTAVPKERPGRFVLVPRVGGTARNLVIDDATIATESWAATEKQAHDLCQLVRAIMRAMAGQVIGGVTVGAVSDVGGPAKLPDPESNQARYIYTASVQARGSAI